MFNPKYALAILLRADPPRRTKSVTTLLFSPDSHRDHHSGAMPQSPNNLIFLQFQALSPLNET
jgi:hypothetical protein